MCTRITAPLSRAGSRRARTRCSATIDVYSEPWVPAIRASTGPGVAPLKTLTGMRVPGSAPSGTTMYPEACWPGWAAISPTRSASAAVADAADAAPASTSNREKSLIVVSLERPGGASCPHERRAPGHAGAEGDEQHEVAGLEASVARALVPEQRDRGRGGVAVLVDVVRHLLLAQPERLGAVLVDALVGLVQEGELEVAGRHAVLRQQRLRDLDHAGGRHLEHEAAVHHRDVVAARELLGIGVGAVLEAGAGH